MEFKFYKPEWLEILRAQEKILRPEHLTAEDCLQLGLIMNRLAKEVYKRPAAFRVITGGQTTFSYLMAGTSTNNEWWMDK